MKSHVSCVVLALLSIASPLSSQTLATKPATAAEARRKGYENIRLADDTERFAAAATEHKAVSANGETTGRGQTAHPAPAKRAATPRIQN